VRLISLATVLGIWIASSIDWACGVRRWTTRRTGVRRSEAHREESASNFDRVERRLDAIDHLLVADITGIISWN
jgi:hypothetical protein